VFFWNAATNGTSVCNTSSTAIALDSGRFSVALPDACASAVKASPDLWAEVLVNGGSLGRTKINAVPYALEAGHATNADNATNATTAATANAAGGALKTVINGLASASSVPVVTAWAPLAATEVFSATTTGGDITNETTVAWFRRVGDSVQLRVFTSFPPATGPDQSGAYLLTLPADLTADLSNFTRSNVGTASALDATAHTETCQAEITGAGNQLYAYCNAARLTTGSPFATPVEIDFDVWYPVKGWTVTQ
jgi:hypothetical protein